MLTLKSTFHCSQNSGSGFAGLLAQQHVDLLFDPGLVVRNVFARRLVKDKAAEICELVDELKQLTDVVRDAGRVRVHLLQVFLKDLARPFKTLIDGLIVRVRATFRLLAWLNEQNCVRHIAGI